MDNNMIKYARCSDKYAEYKEKIQRYWIMFYKAEKINNIIDVINHINMSNPTKFQIIDDHVACADPFLYEHKNEVYLFYEKINEQRINKRNNPDGTGEIYYTKLTYKDNKFHYEEPQLALAESTHLSFPYVFDDATEIYMLPENCRSKKLTLYKSKQFPIIWEPQIILEGSFVDSIIIKHNDYYYLFTTQKFELQLVEEQIYYSKNLLYGWCQHPHKFGRIKGIKGRYRRNGGNIHTINNIMYRTIQLNVEHYANGIGIFLIKKLTITEYEEECLITIKKNIHHISILNNIVTFDSNTINNAFYN